MQQNILRYKLRKRRVLSDADISSGGFIEAFAGEGAVAAAVTRADPDRTVTPLEAYPGCEDDSGFGAPQYVMEHDLTNEAVVLDLLLKIYHGVITGCHFGTPCHTWGLLYQQCGPGHRGPDRWFGSLRDKKEVLGNRTLGVTVLLIRALYESGGTVTFEDPKRSFAWKLACFRSILSWKDVWKIDIDLCEYGLTPGDDRQARYRKGTCVMGFGFRPLEQRKCQGGHRHIPIESSYRNSHGVRVRRSAEAGVYTSNFGDCLAAVHCSAFPAAHVRRRGGRSKTSPSTTRDSLRP
jgi:hypothetical protein